MSIYHLLNAMWSLIMNYWCGYWSVVYLLNCCVVIELKKRKAKQQGFYVKLPKTGLSNQIPTSLIEVFGNNLVPRAFPLKKALGTRLVWQRTLTDVLIFCGLRHLHSMYLFKSLLISWLSWHVRKWSKDVRGWFERPLRCTRSKLDPGDIVSTSLLSV